MKAPRRGAAKKNDPQGNFLRYKALYLKGGLGFIIYPFRDTKRRKGNCYLLL